ncbi:peptidase M50 family [Candidatus Glomeribacter gigasporarum BEG34]|uniref:Peptidase M50 family n=1 Tax=Candidatus Glomeribacter gigasporarum BEG34 TaxID=1070319 RepID=G2JA88_9BURK|nr:site-2 protease family protein [Candidatus Glomeribacter gigasporarum]CCD29689.1 peptidase M50 family [Candidatus Glomeribacter gigasporarum BEG34]
MNNLIQTIAVYALPLLFSITLHEAAHGYVARIFGDSTAYLLGRVSLNPLRHIDPIGTIAIPLLMYFATGGAFLFGYAKPVPVAFHKLRNPRWHSVWVALAGPGCNFLQAALWALWGIVLHAAGITEPFLVLMAAAGVSINLVFYALNLFPLLPLDGGRILSALLPARYTLALARLEPYGIWIVIALIATGMLGRIWVSPLIAFGHALIQILLTPMTALLEAI